MLMLGALAGLAHAIPVPPREGELKIANLSHRAFTVQQLLSPGEVRGFGQTPDGILWLATFRGLASFNGLDVFANLKGDFAIQISAIEQIVVESADVIWLGLRQGGVVKASSEAVSRFSTADGLAPGSLVNLFADRNGDMWSANRGGLARLENGAWKMLSPEALPPGQIAGAFADKAGVIWLATQHALHRMRPGAKGFEPVAPLALDVGSFARFTQTNDGALWLVAGKGGLVEISDHRGAKPRLVRRFPGHTFHTLLADRVGNLWLGGRGLHLLSAPAIQRRRQESVELDVFDSRDGLSGDEVLALYEDRDGLMWVSTTTGIDRFFHDEIVGFPLPRDMRGTKSLLALNDGSLWVADQSAAALIQIRDDRIVNRIDGLVLHTATRDSRDRAWFAGPAGVWRMNGNTPEHFPFPAKIAGNPVWAMAADSRDRIWVSIGDAGVYSLDESGQWRRNGGIAELPTDAATALAADGAGIWLGYPEERVIRVTGNSVQKFTRADGLNFGDIHALEYDGSLLWIGGEAGLAIITEGRIRQIRTQNCPVFRSVASVLTTRNHGSWQYRSTYVSQLEKPELTRFLSGEIERLDCKVLVSPSSLTGNLQATPARAMVETPDRRLWFVAGGRLAYKDLTAPMLSLPPPKPVIVSLGYSSLDGDSSYWHDIAGMKTELPAGTYSVSIRFTAAQLWAPHRLNFRFRLRGLSENFEYSYGDWRTRFSGLGPGEYTFEVSTNNNTGSWSEPAFLQITIQPLFHQTWWFRCLLGLLAVGALAATFQLQLRRATRRLRTRLTERMLERERIARELHDTLLQGFQGLILRFQGAIRRLPATEPVRDTLDQLLDDADAVLIESRDRVSELRQSPYESGELPNAIAEAARKLAAGSGLDMQLTVLGTPRDIDVAVHAETFLIAREALSNAVRHAAARSIAVQITYERNALRLTIRDDGRGIDNDTLRAGGRPGHWGLQGMRERANRLRASLAIRKRLEGGTEVELRIPASLAFTARVGTAQTHYKE